MSFRAKKHTIVLVQFSKNKSTRQYDDFETVSQAMDGICKLYEQKLRMQQPNARNITYDIADLFSYIDGLADLGALIMDPKTNAYTPRNKDWIKNRVFKHLQKMANQPK